MYIKDITLENFRNYNKEKIEFCDNINIIYGNNAQGKTNIVEAIYLCCMGKSFRAKKDNELINFNENSCKAEISYIKVDRQGTIKAEIANQKTFYINGKCRHYLENIGNSEAKILWVTTPPMF